LPFISSPYVVAVVTSVTIFVGVKVKDGSVPFSIFKLYPSIESVVIWPGDQPLGMFKLVFCGVYVVVEKSK